MAGSTGAGYTHFNKISGKNGVFVGAAGSEVRIDTGTQTFTVNLAGASTALEAAYVVIPYTSVLVSAYAAISSGTTGTGGAFTITLSDTAGAAQFGTASFASAGTAGSATLTFGTMATAQISAGSVLAVVKASCATAFGATVTIVATRVASTA